MHLGLKLIYSRILTVSALVSEIRHFISRALLDRSAHGVQNPVHFKSRCSSNHRALDCQSTCMPSALSITLSSVSTVGTITRFESSKAPESLYQKLCYVFWKTFDYFMAITPVKWGQSHQIRKTQHYTCSF